MIIIGSGQRKTKIAKELKIDKQIKFIKYQNAEQKI